MAASGCTYRFIESSLSLLPKEVSCDVTIRQQPVRAKVSVVNERDKRYIEPSPILQIHWKNCSEDELKKCLQSPFYFLVANLVTEDNPITPLTPTRDYMSGSTVSSLHRLRDLDNSDGGFFVFSDLAIKKEGKYKLRFSLFEIVEGHVQNRKTLLSNTFTVFIPKKYPGPVEATFLSRTFSDQGVKMRIRKEHRIHSAKRKIQEKSTTSSPKKYQKKSRTIISSPPYAEKSSSGPDVFFGRWQAITLVNQEDTSSTPSNGYYASSRESSPESQSNNQQSKLLHQEKSSLSAPFNYRLNSPPLSSLAKYHMYSDSKTSNYSRLPTPPASMKDLFTSSSTCGTRLPPLRAILNNQKNQVDFPLLLPPPSSLYQN